MNTTGPLVDIDDAIARMPRYTQEAVDAANSLDEILKRLCRPSWLPFRIVWRWELNSLRNKSYHVLDRVIATGIAWRVIAYHRKLDNERDVA